MCSGLAWRGAGSTALASATFIFIGWLPGAGAGCQGQTIKTRCGMDTKLNQYKSWEIYKSSKNQPWRIVQPRQNNDKSHAEQCRGTGHGTRETWAANYSIIASPGSAWLPGVQGYSDPNPVFLCRGQWPDNPWPVLILIVTHTPM